MERRTPTLLETLTASLLGGITSTIATFPLDTLQTLYSAKSSQQSIYGFVKSLYKQSGIRRFYKGVSTTMAVLPISVMLQVGCFDYLKPHFSKMFGSSISDLKVLASSAFTSYLLTTTLTMPLWTIKTKRQMYSNIHGYENSLSTCRTIIRNEGVTGLWSGYRASLVNSVNTVIQFTFLEKMKEYIAKKKNVEIYQLNPLYTMITAMITSSVIGGIMFPIEVIRCRVQSSKYKYTSISHGLFEIYKNENIRGLYRGLTPYLLRVSPATAISWTVYTFLKDKLFCKNKKTTTSKFEEYDKFGYARKTVPCLGGHNFYHHGLIIDFVHDM